MNRLKIFRFIVALAFIIWSCDQNNVDSSTPSAIAEKLSIDVAETSAQLASGTNFSINGSSTDSATCMKHHGGPGGHGPHGGDWRNPGLLDGLNLLAPNDELLAVVDAESASDIRGLRISQNGGATITNYDANGNKVSLPIPAKTGPQGCSISGQFPAYDSLISKIAKTEINFGSGVTFRRDSVEIIRSGKIIIARTKNGTAVTETTTFDNFKVNGIQIEGTKTRVSTGTGTSTTSVSNGKITFTDGTVATWTSDRSRITDTSAQTVTTRVDAAVIAGNTVIYSHKTTADLVEDLQCHKPGPVSGMVETVYRSNNISIDFGNGSCSNRTVTVIVNGTTTTHTISE